MDDSITIADGADWQNLTIAGADLDAAASDLQGNEEDDITLDGDTITLTAGLWTVHLDVRYDDKTSTEAGSGNARTTLVSRIVDTAGDVKSDAQDDNYVRNISTLARSYAATHIFHLENDTAIIAQTAYLGRQLSLIHI